jgi:phosphomannomutase/phosphoglucomutase
VGPDRRPRFGQRHEPDDEPRPPAPSEPTEENLFALRKTVVDLGAQLGVAHDGDSDRVAFVDETGRYIPGEVTLALFAKYRLRENPGATVTTSVTSSRAVTDVVAQSGGRLVVTRSGSLPVAQGVIDSGAVFGGEENGGYYWPEHQVARDGPMSSAKMLELLASERRPLSELVAEVPKYHLAKAKVPLGHATRAARRTKEIVVEQAGTFLAHDADSVITIDGVKAFYGDSWLLVRPSGTEPICRVFAESRDEAQAKDLLQRGIDLVQRIVGEHPAGS